MRAEIHQKKRNLRERLVVVIRGLAAIQRHPKHRQTLIDLACRVDLTGPINESNLPVKPDGFVVKVPTQLRHRGPAPVTVCQFQVISMAVLYYWLYAATQDAQDLRSCEHYLDWLEEYLKTPERYTVLQNEHLGWYLYPLKGVPDEKPRLPDWLKENNGETV